MWDVIVVIVASAAFGAVGYATGRWQEREAQQEAAERAAAVERDESGRTPGQPTNRRGGTSNVRKGRWSR